MAHLTEAAIGFSLLLATAAFNFFPKKQFCAIGLRRYVAGKWVLRAF